MQCYLVGGAIRDALLGRPVHDRDYVVVGATPQDMINAGFRPVGHDFPVFLHPLTGAEHALARTERKVALGYKGFTFYAGADVTLEQDLQRRDITINAMAQQVDRQYRPCGPIIDPYGGLHDVQHKVLRHVSAAFIEDPVRILRVARFAARFHEFRVAPETMMLMQDIVRRGEADALVAERVWQELSKGLMEGSPYKMLQILRECGAWSRIFKEFSWTAADLNSNPQTQKLAQALSRAAEQQVNLNIRFAIVIHFLFQLAEQEKPARDQLLRLCQRLRVPMECQSFAQIVLAQYDALMQSNLATPEQLVNLFQLCDAWRRSERFDDILTACLLINAFLCGEDFFSPLRQALSATHTINVSVIANSCQDSQAIAAEIKRARIQAIEQQQNR